MNVQQTRINVMIRQFALIKSDGIIVNVSLVLKGPYLTIMEFCVKVRFYALLIPFFIIIKLNKIILADIDECLEQSHTCHDTAQCVNTNGGFRCTCPPIEKSSNCRLNCMFDGSEIAHGITISPAGKPCQRCTCNYGVMTCEEPKCNCSLQGTHLNPCCPQCNPRFACSHQEITDVRFMHGEKWSYQCQTCECLSGEVDCWDMKCPPLPVTCDNPIQAPGDCCPYCADLCESNLNGSSSEKPCHHFGRFYESGAQFADPKDPCTSCNCKVSLYIFFL